MKWLNVPNTNTPCAKFATSSTLFITEVRVSTPDNTLGPRAGSPERGDTPLPLPQPELDPDSLRSDLRDFLQELREAQRERVTERNNLFQFRLVPKCFMLVCFFYFCLFSLILKDDAKCRQAVLQRELEELTVERDAAQSRLAQLQTSLQEYHEGKWSM